MRDDHILPCCNSSSSLCTEHSLVKQLNATSKKLNATAHHTTADHATSRHAITRHGHHGHVIVPKPKPVLTPNASCDRCVGPVTGCNTEVVIRDWTGRPTPMENSTDFNHKSLRGVGLGNDFMQLAEAFLFAEETPKACTVWFDGADRHRRGGLSQMIPSLRSGHVRLRSKYLPNGTAMNTTMQHIHCTMEDAKYANPACQAYVYGSRYGFRLPTDAAQAFSNVSEYARVLRFYLGKQILEHFAPKANRTALDDETLVVYLRSGDTILIPFAGGVTRVEAYFNLKRNETINFFRACIRHSGLQKIHLVSQLMQGPAAHPAIEAIRQDAEANGRTVTGSVHGMQEDFATLLQARNLCLDWSTLGFTAALFSDKLQRAYIPRFRGKGSAFYMKRAHNRPYNYWREPGCPSGSEPWTARNAATGVWPNTACEHGQPGIGFTLPASANLSVFHVDPVTAEVQQQQVS